MHIILKNTYISFPQHILLICNDLNPVCENVIGINTIQIIGNSTYPD